MRLLQVLPGVYCPQCGRTLEYLDRVPPPADDGYVPAGLPPTVRAACVPCRRAFDVVVPTSDAHEIDYPAQEIAERITRDQLR